MSTTATGCSSSAAEMLVRTPSQDQREAMRWVRAHIASFGGDVHRITIDGCSAGAGSVAVHMTSNRSWPLFDQAGGQSGY